LVVVAAFEAPIVAAGFDDFARMSESVEQRSRHLGFAEHAGPLAEGKVGGDDDGGSLVSVVFVELRGHHRERVSSTCAPVPR
jgi:hypothetical protein